MSIIIEDMKMPKSCIVCPFEHNGDCYGGKSKRIMDIEDFNYYRHPNCPLKEIVCCKDCKHFGEADSVEPKYHECKYFSDFATVYYMLEDDYCSCAERREE